MNNRRQPVHTYRVELSNGRILTVTALSAQRASLRAARDVRKDGSDATVISVTKATD